MCDQLLLLATILSQWWQPVASSEALDHLNWVMHALSHQRTTMTIKLASKVGAFFHCCCVSCCPGSRRAIWSK
jgi:hypothetical protein